ncbi:4'-phosphopantetheinyl transferase superfamily protein [Lewinella sp. 4G2]|uniref:4'-phosphopantetheinyl transferase family protein n=1 Tax=Lewinella sp. 4G2 TaxID=1803372 RepID=UPI0007B4DB22|nr:4'-phosphopantetheinyl transferase superfamily protein [Lewinella sp. 4G2]OAV43682.1 hypothetical protein A3850_003845 [Lewinella sp. 4G2]
MTEVRYVHNREELSSTAFRKLEALLPPIFHGSFARYRRWQDRQAGLFGKLLVRQLLKEVLGQPELLATMTVDDHARPSLAFGGDFNISHTNGLIVAALSTTQRIGIDVERHQEVDPAEFDRVFTVHEQQRIRRSKHPQATFYQTWTRKEAAMKADGRGFYLNAADYETGEATIAIDGNDWVLRELPLPRGYTGHLSALNVTEVRIEEVSLLEFLAWGTD